MFVCNADNDTALKRSSSGSSKIAAISKHAKLGQPVIKWYPIVLVSWAELELVVIRILGGFVKVLEILF